MESKDRKKKFNNGKIFKKENCNKKIKTKAKLKNNYENNGKI